jgi:hypothetical protein
MPENNVVSLAPRYARVGPQQIEIVLAALARGETLSSACATAHCSYPAVFARTKRDESFAARIEEARARFHSEVIATAYRLGVVGVEQAILNKDGDVIGMKRKWSERVLLRLLSAIPEYKDQRHVTHEGEVKHDHTHSAGGAITVEALRTLPFGTQCEIRRAMILDAHRKGILTTAQAEEKLADVLLDARERGEPVGNEREFISLPSPVVEVEAVEIAGDSEDIPNFL